MADELWKIEAAEAAKLIVAGTLTSEALVRSCLSRIRSQEPVVNAWAWLDERLAIEQAQRRDNSISSHGTLHGIPVGVKDVFDTVDMPTQQNSLIRANHRPGQDAAAVSLLRSAGAVILGKTTTQEFGAGGRLPMTRNPHHVEHTPGASSSGSAAAVAAGMVPLALGTQTGGSLLRPASYCGVYAMKPTWNVVSREGAKGSSITQDTVGWYGRSVDDLSLMATALGVLAEPVAHASAASALNVALCRTPMWEQAGTASRLAIETAARQLKSAGARVEELELPVHFSRLGDVSRLIMAAEGRTAFMAEYRAHGDLLHQDFRAYVETPVPASAAREGLDFSASCRAEFDRLVSAFDLVLTPSAADEAPRLPDKGDSIFQRMWTLLHVPCINVPGYVGNSGLPIGLTLLSGRYSDAPLLRGASAFARVIRPRR